MNDTVLKNGLPYYVEKSESMKPYWEGLNKDKFMTTQCNSCHTIHFPPTPKLCPKCFGMEMSWVELPLTGTVESHTLVNAPPEGFIGSYYLASVIVDKLDKMILGRFIGDSIEIGDRVKINFEHLPDQSIIIFTK